MRAKNRPPANTSPRQQEPPGADSKVTNASLPADTVITLQNVKKQYKMAFEGLSKTEASRLLEEWMRLMNDGVSVAFDPPDFWQETEPFDFPQYLEKEALIRVLLHLICGEHCRKVQEQKLSQLRNTMRDLAIQQIKKAELEKVMNLHKAAL